MPHTWVTYKENYTKTEDGKVIEDYNKTFNGFFGNCRVLMGIQISIAKKLRLGSETVFSFLNYMKLEYGDLVNYSFRFPMMKWNFTVRYGIF